MEFCEWNPVEHQASYGGKVAGDCVEAAILCVGANGQYHLCKSCADDPKFSRMKKTPLRQRADARKAAING